MTIKEETPKNDDSTSDQKKAEIKDVSECPLDKNKVSDLPCSESAFSRLLNWSKKNRGNRRVIDLGTFKKYLIPSLKEFDTRISELEKVESSITAMDLSVQEISKKVEQINEIVDTYWETIEKTVTELQTGFAGMLASINRSSEITNDCCRDSTESIIRTIDGSIDELKSQYGQMDAQVKRLTRILMKANQAFSDISEPEDIGTNFAEAFRNGYSRALENIPWLAQIRNMLGNDDSIDDSSILKNIRTLVIANITAHEVHDGDKFDPQRMCIVSREETVERKEIGTITTVGNPLYYTVWDDNLGEQTLEKCRVIIKVGDDDE